MARVRARLGSVANQMSSVSPHLSSLGLTGKMRAALSFQVCKDQRWNHEGPWRVVGHGTVAVGICKALACVSQSFIMPGSPAAQSGGPATGA